MSQVCSKTYFATEKDANDYIKKLKATPVRAIKPHRSYLCPYCSTWHLTSKDKNEYDIVAKLREQIKEKNKIIAEKDKIIHERNLQIKELKGGRIWDKINQNI